MRFRVLTGAGSSAPRRDQLGARRLGAGERGTKLKLHRAREQLQLPQQVPEREQTKQPRGAFQHLYHIYRSLQAKLHHLGSVQLSAPAFEVLASDRSNRKIRNPTGRMMRSGLRRTVEHGVITCSDIDTSMDEAGPSNAAGGPARRRHVGTRLPRAPRPPLTLGAPTPRHQQAKVTPN